MKKRIGLVGTGLMGTAIAERLLGAGFDVLVHNRTRRNADPLIEMGATWSDHPIAECDRVVISLYTSETVAEMLDIFGASIRPGSVLIDTTTGEPNQVVALAKRVEDQGGIYLDAPISGSSEQTRSGEVTTIVGGDRETVESCWDVFEAFSARIVHAGSVGSGAKMKLISNVVLGLNRAALAEGLAFAKAIGVDPRAALDVLLHSMAYSKIMDTKGEKMLSGDFRVAAKLSQHLKDIKIALGVAQHAGQKLPLSEAHAQLLIDAEQLGFGESDNSAIVRAFFPFALRDENPLENSDD
jgi:3-hydroxyisobutyrate dehydrogenase-like beta-hydroxyacid dehydrogenase